MPLGKSLGNILDDYFGDQVPDLNGFHQSDDHSFVAAINIPINEIQVSPHQTRSNFDFEKIKNLSENIKKNGLIQPIVVLARSDVKPGEKQYILLAGERRLRACKLLEWKEILAVVKPANSLSNEQQSMITAMENLQREDLSPIELANTYKMLMSSQKISEQDLANMLGVSTQYVKNYLRLLTLSKPVQQALLDNLIGEGQARHLVVLDESKQKSLLKIIIDEQLTVKEIIALINTSETKKTKPELKKATYNLDQEIISRSEDIASKLPNSKIKFSGDHKSGKIIISWKFDKKSKSSN